MRNHRAPDFGIQHSIEFKVICVNCLAIDLLNSIRTHLSMTNYMMCVNRIRNARRLDWLASSQRFCCSEYGILDHLVSRAATERIFQCKANLITSWIRIPFQQGIRGHDLPGDTESTLHRAMFHKGLLEWVKSSSSLGRGVRGEGR